MGIKCNCQRPPGGGIDCPSNSLAICRLEGGECKGYCREIPSGLDKLELNNWILRTVKDDNRSLHQTLSFEDEEILIQKQYIEDNPDGSRTVVRFNMPVTDEISGPDQLATVEV